MQLVFFQLHSAVCNTLNINKEAGYNIGTLKNMKYIPYTGFNKKTFTAEEQQALDWANQNPNDPRSKHIKEKLGVK